MSPRNESEEETRLATLHELRELIAALDRRLPQVKRVGEVAIARTAAALRDEAARRIETLERQLDDGHAGSR
jgi:hypothetical protein